MRLSAIYPVSRQSRHRSRPIHAICVFFFLITSAWAQGGPCEPTPEIGAQLEKNTVVVPDPADFDRAISGLLALRQRYPGDLWVNERYQNAFQQYGIEGHLRKLTEEYQILAMQHPDQWMYSYFYARSLMGRSTPSAIQQMTELVAAHPDFAPAHRALAEIYASPMFRDETKEKTERDRLLALCPGTALQERPATLSDPSLLVDQAERMLSQNFDPSRIAAIAERGIREDEWRLQRIRPFDWYSAGFKRQVQRDLQSKYWRLWAVQVRCYRRDGQPEKAAALLVDMERRRASLRSDSGPVYWGALFTLARLYQEGNQTDLAAQKMRSMQDFLTSHPDSRRSAQLKDLQQSTATP